ncbi:hypothetical protein I350_07975 [Cryptococcus amylolentus CBS 6273]|uniref:Uncharacterized protein n=1 Tax=Cryptococcus amylolentus CBS 6273 TaxID=1296118 RepID=A0A1E3J813_9TREE|nr:hypothetical protein I350_07975 [Cryptococcus amylolentus CBS 6273]
MLYTKTADGTQQTGFLPPDMIAKSIDLWLEDDLAEDDDERVSYIVEAFSEVVVNDAPPAPGGESFMGIKSIPTRLLKRNVIVPLQANSSVEKTDEETDYKKPSWLVLRHYPISQLEGLAKSFGGDENPSIAESINQTCPSLDHMTQFYESRTGTTVGVNADITHEGRKYHVTPSCLINKIRATGESVVEDHISPHIPRRYQRAFQNSLVESINHSISESFIRDGQVVKDNDAYASYDNDDAYYKNLVLRVNAASADKRGVPGTIVVPNYPGELLEEVKARSITELGLRPSEEEELASGPYGILTE